MIFPVGNHPLSRSVNGRSARAFTLVELIMVMALLAIVMAITAPNLASFFRGRTIETEAARFLALTRYAQSRAVSTGQPMVVWIDRNHGCYGLRELAGVVPGQVAADLEPTGVNQFNQELALEYNLAKDLRFELDSIERQTNGVATIRFAPDGAIDETSMECVRIRDKNDEVIPISHSIYRAKYEIGEPTNELVRALR